VSGIAASGQNVDDSRGRADAVIERFLAGSLNGCETISGHTSEYGDHLPITVIDALQSLADFLHRGWQKHTPGRQRHYARHRVCERGQGHNASGIVDSLAAAGSKSERIN